ncbi:MAG: hypothetical protein PHI88_00345 [Candidatus Pacebacteria bacterium]|nr:hypothetical protein [Candidatus Paceibacterota bacterium]
MDRYFYTFRYQTIPSCKDFHLSDISVRSIRAENEEAAIQRAKKMVKAQERKLNSGCKIFECDLILVAKEVWRNPDNI